MCECNVKPVLLLVFSALMSFIPYKNYYEIASKEFSEEKLTSMRDSKDKQIIPAGISPKVNIY